MIDADKEIEGFGTPDVITIASPAAVANAAMSIDADTVTWVNTDNADVATAVLTFTPSAITTATDTVKLYASRNKIDGTVNEVFPSLTNKLHQMAEFVIPVSTGPISVCSEINLDNCLPSQQYEFAIENLLTTVGIDATTWDLTIIPKSKGSRR